MKTVQAFKEGQPIPDVGKYLRSEWITTGYESSGHDMLNDTPVRELFHWYEVPVKEEGK